MDWMFLFIAGVFEIGWAVGLKYSHGFTRLWPSVATAILMILSYIFLAMAIRRIPLGTAYAIWTGIGVVGTAGLGVWLFTEPVNLLRMLFLVMILLGIIGLKLTSSV